MSIAEKLTTVAENQEKVYKAGQKSMVDESKIIEKTVSGTNIVVIDDTSEIPHDVGCKLKSVNLFGLSKAEYELSWAGKKAEITDIVDENNFTIVNKNSDDYLGVYISGLDATKTYSISATVTCIVSYEGAAHSFGFIKSDVPITEENTKSSAFIYKRVYVAQGTTQNITLEGLTNAASLGVSACNNHTLKIENLMICESPTALPYTPYVDVSGVTVKRYGANLFDCLNAPSYENNMGSDDATIVDRTENSITIQKTSDGPYEFVQFALPDNLIGQKITVYAEWTSSGDNPGCIRVNWDTKLESSNIIAISNKSGVSASGVVPEKPSNATHLVLLLYGGTEGKKGDKVYYKNVMVNVGDKTLKFEPYNAQTVQANADGTVDGIKSLCPVMTLSTDVEGVELTVDYHKSWGKQAEYDAFWNAITNNNARKVCSNMFYESNVTLLGGFAPPYQLKPTYAVNMFYTSYGIKRIEKKHIDFSDCNSINYAFYLCYDLEEIEEIYIPNSNIYAFAGCKKLKEIGTMIINDGARFDVSNHPFFNCIELQTIETIVGNIINSVNFQWCPLNKASIKNVVNALSATASGQTLTLKLTAVQKAFETSSGANNGNTSEEWLALVESKSNWTITLV